MSNLPVHVDGFGPSRQLARPSRKQRKTAVAIFNHGLQTRYLAECEMQDAHALSEVVQTALELELANLDYGLQLAAGSAAKAELVARKIELQSRLNNARIVQHFGGWGQ
jgi:hypothetical protein